MQRWFGVSNATTKNVTPSKYTTQKLSIAKRATHDNSFRTFTTPIILPKSAYQQQTLFRREYCQVITISETEKRKRRCHHQSKQRGMLENDLLLGSFAQKYLDQFEDPLLSQFETLLQQPDIEIFRWITGKAEVPSRFDNSIMHMLKEHAKSNPLNYQSDTDNEE
jgi:succinate dehydrogenase assembly factor 2